MAQLFEDKFFVLLTDLGFPFGVQLPYFFDYILEIPFRSLNLINRFLNIFVTLFYGLTKVLFL